MVLTASAKHSIIAVLGLALLGGGTSQAASLQDNVAMCAACHGENGVPQEKTTPVIWGQTEGYLYLQLRDYKRGDRKNDQMQPIAEQLERDDMFALAKYFAHKPWPRLGQAAAAREV